MNRRWLAKTALSLAGLGVFVVLAAGSIDTEEAVRVSVETITQAKQELTRAMEQVKLSSRETSQTVTTSYEELKTYLDLNNLSDQQLRSLENAVDAMKARRDSLRADLKRTIDEASDLFRLLRRRAEENETEELREQMMANIEEKKDALEEKLQAAADQMDRIDQSIQKFDDIVGYLQVNRGLEGVEKMTEDIDQIIATGAEFDDEIRAQIEQGMELIEGL